MKKYFKINSLFIFAGLLAVSMTGHAQWQPERHVELIVPSSAGGSLDNVGRTFQRLWDELKLVPTSSAVVNRAGGGHAKPQRLGCPIAAGQGGEHSCDEGIAGADGACGADLERWRRIDAVFRRHQRAVAAMADHHRLNPALGDHVLGETFYLIGPAQYAPR